VELFVEFLEEDFHRFFLSLHSDSFFLPLLIFPFLVFPLLGVFNQVIKGALVPILLDRQLLGILADLRLESGVRVLEALPLFLLREPFHPLLVVQLQFLGLLPSHLLVPLI